jgi:hypothetical protein
MFGTFKNALEYTRAILGGREGFHMYLATKYTIGMEICKEGKFYTVVNTIRVNPSSVYTLFVRS